MKGDLSNCLCSFSTPDEFHFFFDRVVNVCLSGFAHYCIWITTNFDGMYLLEMNKSKNVPSLFFIFYTYLIFSFKSKCSLVRLKLLYL